jgi:tRNA pseudouridine32 synthase/23S rRNA pseudouridine746 synthase
MAIAKRPSHITLPSKNDQWATLLDYLAMKFPHISRDIWIARLTEGKMHWRDGETVNLDTAFIVNKTLCYYREVENDPIIPFKHDILYQNEHFLVACKPHFLPVTPGGKYVNECLLERLRQELDNPDIVPLHRLDRETAGLVLFSLNQKTRGIYSQLFEQKKISKNYHALANIKQLKIPDSSNWDIANRLVKSLPRFLMEEGEGEINAHTKITLKERDNDIGLFNLQPITGKTHQLRLHMMKIGAAILNDKFYPTLLPEEILPTTIPKEIEQLRRLAIYQAPLQLLAKKLEFIDPLTKQSFSFESPRQLSQWDYNYND